MQEKYKKSVWLTILVVIIALNYAVVGCGEGSTTLPTPPRPTETPSPTSTPTQCPTIILPTLPTKVLQREQNLFIILVDTGKVGELKLGNTTPVPFKVALSTILHAWVGEGDRIVFIQLGCRYTNSGCYILNDILPTPFPRGSLAPPSPTFIPSLTPVPSPTPGTNLSLFQLTAAARHWRQTATIGTPTQGYIATINTCAIEEWKRRYLATYESYRATETAAKANVGHALDNSLTEISVSPSGAIPTPYAPDVLLDGLYQASVVLNNERGNYDRFYILIFDDFQDWRVDEETGALHDLSFPIDLEGADIFLFLPQCEETYLPTNCETLISSWQTLLLEHFRASSATPIPNSRIMERLQPFLKQRYK